MNVSRWMLRIVFLAVALGCDDGPSESPGSAASRVPQVSPRHLLLISVDTLRADRLGAYGSDFGLTPNIDRLSQGSVRFASAYSTAPFTLPSVATIHTGLYPETLSIKGNIGTLPDSATTLASRLRKKGFASAAVGRVGGDP